MIEAKYDIFCDFDILQKAHQRARRCKRHKASVVKFEMDEITNISRLREELVNKTYKMGNYYSFTVLDPKPRKIAATPYRDRIVQHVICDHVLEPYFTKKAIYDNTGCVRGRGQHFAVRRMRKFLKEHYHAHRLNGYFLKCDILKFFHSLSHDVIKKQISTHIKDPDIRALFDLIVDSYQTDLAFLNKYNIPTHQKKFIGGRWQNVQIKRGVPIGNQMSQIIGMFHLNDIDRFCKEKLRVKHYIRYMDDFILIHHDKKFLEDALKQIKELLWKELRLKTNDKTQIHPIKNGVNFLGNMFYVKENGKIINKIIPRTVRKLYRRVKHINQNYDDLDPQNLRSVLASYKGHFQKTSSRGRAAKIMQGINVSVKKKIRKPTKKEIFEQINAPMG